MSGRTLLRGGCVLTLGRRTPNLPRGDVLIEDGRVAEVGQGVRARDAEVLEASDAIVMPGFVDAHRHGWSSILRNAGDRGPSVDGPEGSALATHLSAEQARAATAAADLGALEAGVTTIADWWDLPGDDERAIAAVRAHGEIGLRSVFVVGGAVSREGLQALARAAGSATTIALGCRLAPDGLAELEQRRRLASDLGLRVHVHPADRRWAPGVIAAVGARGALGDVTVVHGAGLDPRDLDAALAAGSSVVVAPSSEMAGSFGVPPVEQLFALGCRPGLGVGDERLGPGDLFAQMRAVISWQHAMVFDRKLAGKGHLPRLMTTRDVLRYATTDGAAALGLGEVVGTLEPGMRADLIVLRTDRLNIFPVNDPIGAVVWGCDTSNVQHVFVDGRPLVRDGALDPAFGPQREAIARARLGVASTAVVDAEGRR